MSIKDYVAEAERCSQCSYCKWIPFDQIKSLRFGLGCPAWPIIISIATPPGAGMPLSYR